MFNIGDVVYFFSDEAEKKKYHLCVSFDGHYLYINSPKLRSYPGDFIFPSSELDFIEPTESGDSIISCSYITRISDVELRRRRANRVGSVTPSLIKRLYEFIENNDTLSEEDKEIFLSSFGDWL